MTFNNQHLGNPFPNIYFDNIFPSNILLEAAREFPEHHLQEELQTGWNYWLLNKNSNLKYFLRDEELMVIRYL